MSVLMFVVCSGDFSVNFDSDESAFHLFENACLKLAEVSYQFRLDEVQALGTHHRFQPLYKNFLYSIMMWCKCIENYLDSYVCRYKLMLHVISCIIVRQNNALHLTFIIKSATTCSLRVPLPHPVSIGLKFHEARQVPLTLTTKWKEFLLQFGHSIVFNFATIAELKSGLEMGWLLRLPSELAFNHQHLGNLLAVVRPFRQLR